MYCPIDYENYHLKLINSNFISLTFRTNQLNSIEMSDVKLSKFT